MLSDRRAAFAIIIVTLAACATPSAELPSATEPAASGVPSGPPTASAPQSPFESASASPSARQANVSDGWTPVLVVGGDESTRTVGAQIAHGSAGFLAITGRWTSDGLSPGPGFVEYSVWHSPNGLEWSEREYPSEFGNLSVGALVSAADESYILHGVRGTAGYEAVALRSRDGMTWEQIDTGLPQVIYVQAIERGPAGYLLVGGQGADINPTLWLSEDGLAWELVHEFDQTEQWVQIHDADGGEEGYVVLGRRIEPDNSYRRFAFASADGRTWFSRDQPFGADNQAYVAEASVSSLGPDWVATLGQPDAPTAVWFSTDGLGWSEVGSVDAPANTSTAEFHEVAGALVFSPGSGLRGLPEGTAGVWSSVDGVGWAPVDFGADVWLGGIAEGDGITAAIGTLPRPDFTSAASIWVRVSD